MPCVFLGYAHNQKGFRCLHIDTNRIFISRNVQFDEQVFPFAAQHFSASTSLGDKSDDLNFTGPPLLQLYLQAMGPSRQPEPTTVQPRPGTPVTTSEILPAQDVPLLAPNLNMSPAPATQSDRVQQQHTPVLTPQLQLVTTSNAETQSPIPNPPSIQPSTHHMVTRNRDNTRKKRCFPDHVAYLASTSIEPTSFTQANALPEWRAAMAKEIDALAHNQTWVLVPPPPDQRVIGSKWVFKIKRHSDGSIERYKARLVAKGYHQQEGIDFTDTFSPVVRPTTIRIVLSLAVSSNWSIRQLDVQNAFLHGDLSNQVFMSQPPGFTDPAKPDHVCLLSKAIYSLKQSPRAWFHKLSQALLTFGFASSQYDPSMFIAHVNGSTIIVLVYVDDIIITGDNQGLINTCIAHLHTQFAIKDLGSLHYFLGIAVTTTSEGLHLSQSKYIHDLLQKTNMLNAKPTTTPIATGISLTPGDSEPFSDPHLYRSIVGALQYATVTRPDLSFAVNKLSQFMHSPNLNQWTAVKRVLRYLCGTMQQGLLIHHNSDHSLHAYTDSDWAGCPIDRRSTSGYCIFLGKNIISWSAKKQNTVSRSSTEAEYRGLALTCAELLWVQYILQELHIHLPSPPIMWCDNIGATFLASNPMFHSRTKHVEIDFHFVRERITSNSLLVRYLCSVDQLADIMTKPLSTTRFQFLCNKLNVTYVPLACGGVLVNQLEVSSDTQNG
ncbi:polyprotein [Rhynchospora pubera]|uniref:Polyprotein n=1 Tax=Rhynchospora pubera TaxID=906938 RepID=A0AAV8CJH2_9POAL|nr:polyprotein [Rhynchospora pubera]